MRFEHLVEINDLNNPLTFNLSRTQLWAGLMARVEDSRPFLPGMDECLILEREAALVRRLLRFGGVEIRDTVTFVEEEWVCFTTEPSAQHAGGTLTIRIETPRPDLPELDRIDERPGQPGKQQGPPSHRPEHGHRHDAERVRERAGAAIARRIDDGDIVPFFQPEIDATTGKPVNTGSLINTSVGLSASLDLFTGFRRGANRRAAQATTTQREAAQLQQEYATALAAKQAFFTALANAELVTVAQSQLRRSDEQLKLTTEKLRLGATTRADSLSAMVDYGNSQLQLIQAQANLQFAQVNLGRTIGIDGAVAPVADSALEVRLGPLDTVALRNEATANAPSVRQAEASLAASRASLSASRSQYMPTISASASQSWARAEQTLFSGIPFTSSWSVRVGVAPPSPGWTPGVSSITTDAPSERSVGWSVRVGFAPPPPVGAGVPQAVGTRWFRKAGGMPPAMFRPSAKPLSGRYLSFAEREEIALLRVQGARVPRLAAMERVLPGPRVQVLGQAWAVGQAEVGEIDRLNIYWAGILSLRRAVLGLTPRPEHLLIDARRIRDLDIPQDGIVHGDALSLTIAAASILAKTARDALMAELDAAHPGYGFARHKGYPTAEHFEALGRLGACIVHRRSFAPVRQALGLEPAQGDLFTAVVAEEGTDAPACAPARAFDRSGI